MFKKINYGAVHLTEENKPVEKKLTEEKKEASIQQLNLSYDKVQDRLLFRVGLSDNTELVLWFTYRFSRQLWAALNGEAHLPAAKPFASKQLPAESITQFKQEAQATKALKKMDFATEYTPRKAIRNDKVMLATEMKLSEAGAKHLEITCQEGVVVNINLNQELVLALCNMLQLTTKEAEWDMDVPTVPAIKLEGNETGVLH
jgi:hypothetical protein